MKKIIANKLHIHTARRYRNEAFTLPINVDVLSTLQIDKNCIVTLFKHPNDKPVDCRPIAPWHKANKNFTLKNKNIFVTPGTDIPRDYIKRYTGAKIVRLVSKADCAVSSMQTRDLYEIDFNKEKFYSTNRPYVSWNVNYTVKAIKIPCFKHFKDAEIAENKIPVLTPDKLVFAIWSSFDNITKEEVISFFDQALSSDDKISKLGIDNMLCKKWENFPFIKDVCGSLFYKEIQKSNKPTRVLFGDYNYWLRGNYRLRKMNIVELCSLLQKMNAFIKNNKGNTMNHEEKYVMQHICNKFIERSDLPDSVEIKYKLLADQQEKTKENAIPNIDNLII